MSNEIREDKKITINVLAFGRDLIIIALILYWLLKISDWLFGVIFR